MTWYDPAIGYRVRYSVGVQFRNWISKSLKEYMQKRFVMRNNYTIFEEESYSKGILDTYDISIVLPRHCDVIVKLIKI